MSDAVMFNGRNYTKHEYKLNAKVNKTVSIAFFSDIHNQQLSDSIFSDIEGVDFVIVAGDLVFGKELRCKSYADPWWHYQKNAFLLLQQLVAIKTVFFSLGNHECLLSDEDIESIKNVGACVLDNEYVRYNSDIVVGGLTSGLTNNYIKLDRALRNEDRSFARGGFHYEFYHHGESDFELSTPHDAWLGEFEKQKGYKILMSHHPEYWGMREPMLKNRRIDLVLSGHAHGGQIRVMNQGIYAPGQGLFPAYSKGLYNGKYGNMIVGAGLANTYFVPRLFNPTELVIVHVSPQGNRGQ